MRLTPRQLQLMYAVRVLEYLPELTAEKVVDRIRESRIHVFGDKLTVTTMGQTAGSLERRELLIRDRVGGKTYYRLTGKGRRTLDLATNPTMPPL